MAIPQPLFAAGTVIAAFALPSVAAAAPGEAAIPSIPAAQSHDMFEMPEPPSWALMLFGFAALGSAMRSSRRKGRKLPS